MEVFKTIAILSINYYTITVALVCLVRCDIYIENGSYRILLRLWVYYIHNIIDESDMTSNFDSAKIINVDKFTFYA